MFHYWIVPISRGFSIVIVEQATESLTPVSRQKRDAASLPRLTNLSGFLIVPRAVRCFLHPWVVAD